MIYFAYGSNMEAARIVKRCPSAKFLFKAKLPDFRLDFTRFSTGNQCGVADIIRDLSATVWGVVYEIDDKDKTALEKFEGVPVRAYEPCTVEVQPDGDRARSIQATTYVVVTKLDPRPKPDAEYKARIVNGAKHWKLPAEYIASLEKIEVAPIVIPKS